MEAIQRLFALGGGDAQLRKMPLLRPYETPYPDPTKNHGDWPHVSEAERAEMIAGAELLLESRQFLEQRFGLSPWSIYQMLLMTSRERRVSFLTLTRRLLASLG